MGQIAEDMIDGCCCELCGQYFVSGNVVDKSEYEIMSGEKIYEHGYPVTCWECWEDLNESEKKGRTKSVVKTI